jgi:hypothetical protein
MLGEFPGVAWHIYWTLGEHPPVLMEELDECTFLCREERIRHPRGLGWIRRVDLVLLGVFTGIK